MPHGKDFLRRLALGLCLVLPWLAGCAAFHPMNGVPARYIPDDMKVGRRNGKRTIDPSLLSQEKPPAHLIDSGDVLGIYVGGVLGKIDENPPVQFPQNPDYQPAAGVPVTVREDGTISLPMIGPLNLRGKTTREAEEAIRHAYTDDTEGKEFLREGRQRILVSLQRPRQTVVLVIRQDSRNEPVANAMVGQLNIGTAKRGSGKLVSLPAYRNDVLNALVATDGLPGLDAENAVYIIRRRANRLGQDPLWSADADPEELIRNSDVVKKPVIRSQSSDGWDYRSPQPWNMSNGTQSLWNRDNSQLPSIQPTPINPSQRPISPTPNPGLQPQTGVPNGTAGQSNWPPQSSTGAPQFGGPMVPGQGYSLPDAATLGSDTMNPDAMQSDPGNDGPQGTMNPDDISLTEGRRIIRIPIRLGPDEHVDIKKEDVILHDGDIVFIESRDTEVFFTGGLLGGGQFTLPRDFDLDILQALSIATSRAGGAGAARQIGGVSALNSDVTISPSNVIIIRKLPEGGEVPIKIDLYRARSDLSERMIVQPGDYIYLQYTPFEAVAAFFERHLLEGALFGVFASQVKN